MLTHNNQHLQVPFACLVASVTSYPFAFPDGPGPVPGGLPIPRPGADGSYAGDNNFQYINVPALYGVESCINSKLSTGVLKIIFFSSIIHNQVNILRFI